MTAYDLLDPFDRFQLERYGNILKPQNSTDTDTTQDTPEISNAEQVYIFNHENGNEFLTND